MIHVRGGSIERLGLPVVRPGQLKRADLFGIDDGVVLGQEDHSLILMPHGGVAVVRQIGMKLAGLGWAARAFADPSITYPEASSEIEAWSMHALSLLSSPMGVDVLLEHTTLWRELGIYSVDEGERMGRSSDVLDRLLHPPTVAAVGRANIGKSSLLNTLVGQRVALVADVAGTTRDHVGVPVELGGLVVRWIDTPGVDERIGDADEIGIATRVIGHADLVVHCIDSSDDDGRLDPRIGSSVREGVGLVRVGMRSDLGSHPCGVDVRVSAGSVPEGISELVGILRDRLMPEDELRNPSPWRFWTSLRNDG